MRRRCSAVLVAGLFVVSGLLAAGCGEDSAVASDDPYVVALAANLVADPGLPVSEGEAGCLAAVVVDAVGGSEALSGAGLNPEDLESTDEAISVAAGGDIDAEAIEVIAAGLLDCGISMGGVVAEAMGDEVSDELVGCLDEQFTEDVIGEMLLAELDGPGTDGDDVVLRAVLECAEHLDDGGTQTP